MSLTIINMNSEKLTVVLIEKYW